jgi:hypothetical protein
MGSPIRDARAKVRFVASSMWVGEMVQCEEHCTLRSLGIWQSEVGKDVFAADFEFHFSVMVPGAGWDGG